MNKKVRLLFILFLVSLLFTQNIFASECRAVIDSDKGLLIVTGSLDTKGYGRNVTVELISPGHIAKPSQQTNEDELNESLVAVFTGTVDYDGSFTVAEKVNGSTGNYIARVYADGFVNPIERAVTLISSQDAAASLNKVNSTGNSSELANLLEQDKELYSCLQLDKTDYNIGSKNDICNVIISRKQNQPAGKYESLSILISDFQESVFLDKFNRMSKSNLESFIKSSAQTLNIESSAAYKEFKNQTYMGAKAKNAVLSAMSGKIYTSYNEIKTDFIEQTVVNTVEFIEHNSLMCSFLESAAEYLNISNFNTYKNLSSARQELIAEYIKKCNVKTIDDLNQAVYNGVILYENADIEKENESGISGGGGSLGGAVSSGKGMASGYNPPETKAVSLFSDLDGSHWAYQSFAYLKNIGAVQGDEYGKCNPDVNITRAEFLKIMLTALNLTDYNKENTVNTFMDSNPQMWNYPYIMAAKEKGIAKGISENEFGCDELITREDAAVLSYNSIKVYNNSAANNTQSSDGSYTGGNTEYSNKDMVKAFSDEQSVSGYASEAVEFLRNSKIINGVGNGNFMPKNNLTRAEAVKIIYELRVMQKGPEQ